MFGSPDDVSTVSQSTTPNSTDMQTTISDSDLIRDAKHVCWQPLPFIPDTARTSLPSRSKDSLLDDDIAASSTKSKRGLGVVKAKIKAVARFLGPKDKNQEDAGFSGLTGNGVPIAGVQPQSILLKENAAGEVMMRGDGLVQKVRKTDMGQRDVSPVIETSRERLSSEVKVCKKPPPPPQPQIFRPPPPRLPTPTAVCPKRRHPIDPESLPHVEQPRPRSGTPRPALPPPVRVTGRPLPPIPAHHPNPAPTSIDPDILPYGDPFSQHCNFAPGLGLSETPDISQRPHDTLHNQHVSTRNDSPPPAPAPAQQPFPTIRRAKNTLDAARLSEELESLSSLTSSRHHRRHRRQSKFSTTSSAATRIADSSREAVCHWTPQDDPATNHAPSPRPRTSRSASRKQRLDSTQSSIRAQESEDSESIHRIQQWRVQITTPPSHAPASEILSQFAKIEEYEVSSHLTSVSRSPLSKPSSTKSRDDELEDVEKTPTLQARRVVRLGKESPKTYKSPPGPNCHQRNEPKPHGTHHIARLSDDQFDRLARATEGTPPPSPAPIPVESSVHQLHPHTANRAYEKAEEDRRSSLEASGTTLSVLERKASTHINTLDSMIHKHPDKMYEIFRNRPGLMLVVMLRCKVEDRISEVQPSVLVDLAPSTSGRQEVSKDAVDFLEESLIDLRFDDEEPPVQVPDIVVSQHHTGGSAAARSRTVASDGSSVTQPYTQGDKGKSEVGTEVENRTESKLQEIVQRLEQAGELCSMQQVLMSLQERLMNTNGEFNRLMERLSIVSTKCIVMIRREGRKREGRKK